MTINKHFIVAGRVAFSGISLIWINKYGNMFAKVNIPCEDPSKNDLDMQGHNSNIQTK